MVGALRVKRGLAKLPSQRLRALGICRRGRVRLKPASTIRTERASVAELISVIVTTYNRPDALEAVMRSLARQTDKDFEVVVADDGSSAATGQLIEAWNCLLYTSPSPRD